MRLDNELWMRKATEKEDELCTILWSGPDSRRFSIDNKMRILVTGGDGYIGSNLMHHLNPDVILSFLKVKHVKAVFLDELTGAPAQQ